MKYTFVQHKSRARSGLGKQNGGDQSVNRDVLPFIYPNKSHKSATSEHKQWRCILTDVVNACTRHSAQGRVRLILNCLKNRVRHVGSKEKLEKDYFTPFYQAILPQEKQRDQVIFKT